MSDLYFWYQYLPAVDPAKFDSPEAYLDAVRYRPLDSTFSYVTSREANQAFFSDSQFIGFGFSSSLEVLNRSDDDAMRVTQVFALSPAEEAGLRRGARIVEINGVSVSDLIARGEIDNAFGPAEVGVEAQIVFQKDDGQRQGARMVKRLVTIPTVSLTRAYDTLGRKTGYIFFRNFVEPSYAALDQAFGELRSAGVRDLILDLRYNGGGLVAVAQYLAGLIGGVRTEGQVFTEYFHNDKNAFRNRTTRFDPKPNALNLDRLIVITTRASASASELVINALRPFIPVTIIGDRTYGKPVGQYSIPFCDKVLAPVAFTLRNASGEGDFFDGLAPTCVASDDTRHQLGDVLEASLREALTFVQTNACSPAVLTPRLVGEGGVLERPTGWQSILNAN
jgi:C-terminal processing protease CtpA/Prc